MFTILKEENILTYYRVPYVYGVKVIRRKVGYRVDLLNLADVLVTSARDLKGKSFLTFLKCKLDIRP